MIHDVLPGDRYKIEYVRLEIVSSRNARLASLVALRKLLGKGLRETVLILDSLPYVLYDGPTEKEEWLSLSCAAYLAGFEVRETMYLKDMVA